MGIYMRCVFLRAADFLYIAMYYNFCIADITLAGTECHPDSEFEYNIPGSEHEDFSTTNDKPGTAYDSSRVTLLHHYSQFRN
jgi:hypothetical protein